jgi:hypothetical protein
MTEAAKKIETSAAPQAGEEPLVYLMVLQDIRIPFRNQLVTFHRGQILHPQIDAVSIARLKDAFAGKTPPVRRIKAQDLVPEIGF